MKVLVIADSAYGNTWEVASAIADAFGNSARAIRPPHVQVEDIAGLDLLIVGSPTQGGRPLPSITQCLRGLAPDGLKGIAVAAFDTRVDARQQSLPLRLLVNLIGYAAPKIGRELTSHGGRQVVPLEGFIVEGKEGPVRAGEIQRAADWARRLQAAVPR
jgi:flavodoxin